MMTGTPFNITYSGTALAAPGNTQTPNLVGSFSKLKGINVGNPIECRSELRLACPLAAAPQILGACELL